LVYSPRGLERLISELQFATAAHLFLAGGTLSAHRPSELGLVSRIVEPDGLPEVAVAIATQIAGLAPVAARANRRALRALRRSPAALEDADRARLPRARAEGLRSADFAEGVAALRAHRSPGFTGC
jgi:enoyl-CoA hydratase/carnithine racemase